MTHRLLALYALLATATAFACGAGWWFTRAELDRVETERPATRAGSTAEPMPPRAAVPLTPPPAGERGTETTTSATSGDRPSPAETEAAAHGAAGLRCPHCGKEIPPGDARRPRGALGSGEPDKPADAKKAASATGAPSSDFPWPPHSLSEIPGATLQDKVAAFVDRLRTQVEGLPPGDLKTRYQLREMLGEILKEAKNDPGLPRVLLDLFTSEAEETVAEALGGQLQYLNLSKEDRAEFDRLLETLTASADPLQRKKGFRHLDNSKDHDDLERWAQALRTDFDAGVRAVAAGHPLRNFPDGGDLLVQAARFDSDLSVRLAAIHSLGETASPTEMSALVGLLRTDPNIGVQEAAIRAFSYGATPRDTEVRQVLLDVGRDPARATSVRMQALQDLLWGHSGSFVEDPAERNELESLFTRLKGEADAREGR